MTDEHRFLFLSANPPWVYGLAEALAQQGSRTAAITLFDWVTHRLLRPTWPNEARPDLLDRAKWVFPTGYMGALEPAFRHVIRSRLRRILRRYGRAETNWIVCPFPWLLGSVNSLPDCRLIYFNLDDYRLYRPERLEKVERQEDELIRRSEITLCLAQTQVQYFAQRFPDRAATFRHLPLAAPDAFRNPSPGRGFRDDTVGYVGNLIDRVDWRLVTAVARLLPEFEFVFVGYSNVSGGGGQRPDWKRDRDEALSLSNVRQVDTVPQAEVPKHYWSFGMTWIPYATDHIFNHASCPTKIMDGLASGRPVLSTDIPECRLYSRWITIVHSAEEAAAAIRRIRPQLHSPEAIEASRQQVDFVSQHHSWRARAQLVQKWLSSSEGVARP